MEFIHKSAEFIKTITPFVAIGAVIVALIAVIVAVDARNHGTNAISIAQSVVDGSTQLKTLAVAGLTTLGGGVNVGYNDVGQYNWKMTRAVGDNTWSIAAQPDGNGNLFFTEGKEPQTRYLSLDLVDPTACPTANPYAYTGTLDGTTTTNGFCCDVKPTGDSCVNWVHCSSPPCVNGVAEA